MAKPLNRLFWVVGVVSCLSLATYILVSALVTYQRHQREARVEYDLRQGATYFWIEICSVSDLIEKRHNEEIEKPTREGATWRAWKEYFATAVACKDAEVVNVKQDAFENGSVFNYELRGSGTMQKAWVVIPDQKIAKSNYIAVVLTSEKLESVEGLELVAFSPSTPAQLFVRPIPPTMDPWAVVRELVDSYDWRKPFDPDKATWTHDYQIQKIYPPLQQKRLRPQ